MLAYIEWITDTYRLVDRGLATIASTYRMDY